MGRLTAVACSTLWLCACAALQPPLTTGGIDVLAAEISSDLERSRLPLNGRLDPDSAVERAIGANLEIETARYAAAVEEAKVRAERGELLPAAATESEYSRRSNRSYSRSSRSLEYSSSTDISSLTHNLNLSLNLLDFGLTLIRMRQAADRASYKHEEARRVALRIAEQTRAAYWRTVALQLLVPRLARLTPRVNEALRLSRQAARNATFDPADFIAFQRDLLNTRREINDVFADLAGADTRLRTLLNADWSGPLELDSRRSRNPLPMPTRTAGEDIAIAMRQRPEIRQAFYEMRITDQEVMAALLRVLPGATITESFRNDSNSYLLEGTWTSFSVRLAANFTEILRLPGKIEAIDAQQQQNRMQALLVASQIAMQVYVARSKLQIEYHLYRDADEFARNQLEVLKQVRGSILAGRMPEQAAAREELSELLARVRAIVAYADFNAAHASYQAAIGDGASDVL